MDFVRGRGKVHHIVVKVGMLCRSMLGGTHIHQYKNFSFGGIK